MIKFQRKIELEEIRSEINQLVKKSVSFNSEARKEDLNNYIVKDDLSFLNKSEYQNILTDIENLKSENYPRKIKFLEKSLNQNMKEDNENLFRIEKELDGKLKNFKLEISEFRAKIINLQQKTMSQAEEVLSEFSKKKLDEESNLKLVNEDLKVEMIKSMKERRKVEDLEENINSLKINLRKLEEMFSNKRVNGLEEVDCLQKEVHEEIQGLKESEYLKEMVVKQVAKALSTNKRERHLGETNHVLRFEELFLRFRLLTVDPNKNDIWM